MIFYSKSGLGAYLTMVPSTIRVSTVISYRILRSDCPKHCFHCGSIMNPTVWHSKRTFSLDSIIRSEFWQSKITLSLWFDNEFCILAIQSQICHCDCIMNSAFWQSQIACSLRLYNEFCVLALQYRVFAFSWISRAPVPALSFSYCKMRFCSKSGLGFYFHRGSWPKYTFSLWLYC